MAKEVKLSPPWCTFVSELRKLFGEDKDIEIKYEDGDNNVYLYVEDEKKAEALEQLLPNQRIYGNVVLNVTVVPANKKAINSSELFMNAFKDNPVLSDFVTLESPYGRMSYAMFRKEVVQFYDDDLSDPHGNKSTLFEDIARDVFGDSDVFFCTDTEDK